MSTIPVAMDEVAEVTAVQKPKSSPLPPTLAYRLTSITEHLPLQSLFPLPQSIEVELGAGAGSFLAQYAQLHPDRNFLAVERLLGRLRKLDRKARRTNLQNLRLVSIEASYLVAYLLPPESVAALHIYFPDPWPKRKHRSNRLINTTFVLAASRCLVDGGVVYLRTDHANYFAQMLEVFGGNKNFAPIDTPRDLAEVTTDFERGFVANGIATNRAAYRKVAEPLTSSLSHRMGEGGESQARPHGMVEGTSDPLSLSGRGKGEG